MITYHKPSRKDLFQGQGGRCYVREKFREVGTRGQVMRLAVGDKGSRSAVREAGF